MMGHLNSFSASGAGNLNKNFGKNSNARGLPGRGMLKLRFDWYIRQMGLFQCLFNRSTLVLSNIFNYTKISSNENEFSLIFIFHWFYLVKHEQFKVAETKSKSMSSKGCIV